MWEPAGDRGASPPPSAAGRARALPAPSPGCFLPGSTSRAPAGPLCRRRWPDTRPRSSPERGGAAGTAAPNAARARRARRRRGKRGGEAGGGGGGSGRAVPPRLPAAINGRRGRAGRCPRLRPPRLRGSSLCARAAGRGGARLAREGRCGSEGALPGRAARGAMVQRQKAAAAGAKRRPAAALLLGPASSEDEADEAPEEVSFGAAREAAATERKLVGEAARR